MYVVNIHEQSEMHKDAVFKEIADDHGTEVAFDIMQINYNVCSGLNIPPIEMLYSCKNSNVRPAQDDVQAIIY